MVLSSEGSVQSDTDEVPLLAVVVLGVMAGVASWLWFVVGTALPKIIYRLCFVEKHLLSCISDSKFSVHEKKKEI